MTWCDFVVAADDAEFGFPEVRLGLPTIVGAIRLPEPIGWQPAMELLLTGDRLLAAAPLAARAAKEMAARARNLPMTEAIRFGGTMRTVTAATADATEGPAAAREHRPPVWQAR